MREVARKAGVSQQAPYHYFDDREAILAASPPRNLIHKELIMAAQSVPDGHHTVTPYLTVRDALKVIDFLKSAFGAEVTHEPLKRPDGKS